jgi:membrane dipeptidase
VLRKTICSRVCDTTPQLTLKEAVTTSSQNGTQRVFDLHSDLVVDITNRRAKGERQVFQRHHYPRLQESGVMAVCAVLWVEPAFRQQTFSRFIQLLTSLMADIEESRDCVQLVADMDELTEANRAGRIGLFLGVEGMTFVEEWPLFDHEPTNDALTDISFAALEEKFRQAIALLKPLHLRHAILVWGERNQIASGPGPFYRSEMGQGLTEFGRTVVRELQRADIVIDLSHLDDASIDDVLDVAQGPVIASHSNARRLCDVPRNLSDRHIKEIGARGGVIGINAYPEFVHPTDATLDAYIDHVVYIADKIGIEGVALGFDFVDYIPEFASTQPGALAKVEEVPLLIKRLYERGFTDREVECLAWNNALRIMG